MILMKINSPCKKICKVDKVDALCISCNRSLTEIRTWTMMTDSQRADVMKRIEMSNLQRLVDDAYVQGKQAYKDSKKEGDNPYNVITEIYQFFAWKEGYYNSKFLE